MSAKKLLELQNISKAFAGNTVLEQVSMDIVAGEIHALLGENGAGKSTLLNIISGSLKKDGGSIIINGREEKLVSPLQGRQLGIVKVHQELQIIPELTVAENIFLANELRHPLTKAIWYNKMYEEADVLLKKLEADFSSKILAKNLSTAQKQLVEIAKALLKDFSVLILDEPTSSLTDKEIRKLFSIMQGLKNNGKGIIFVSHRMEEVLKISDRVTVLRDGRAIQVFDAKNVKREELIKAMTGRDLSKTIKNETAIDQKEVVLSVKDLTSSKGKFQHINFELYKGEILGFSGLVGSGRTEIMRAIFGADPKKGGEIYLYGKKIDIKTPEDSVKNKIALIPEDRKLQGFVGLLPNMHNIGITSYSAFKRYGILLKSRIMENAKDYMAKLKVHPQNENMLTNQLSGGNQQKVVIAKWLSAKANILIMDEPTRGIDVGAKEEIYRLMLELIAEGVSIIMVSSDLPEVISMSNRILVMHEGEIAAEIMHEDATEEKILYYAMGGK